MSRDPEPTTAVDAVGPEHWGDLWLAGDDPEAAVDVSVAISDEGRLVVASSGLVLADWLLSDIAIESKKGITTLRCGDDVLEFAPNDTDAWDRQLAAHRIRSRLIGSPLAARPDAAPAAYGARQASGLEGVVGTATMPPVQVMQSTVVSTPRRTSHWLHLLLTVLTFGLWLPVWIGVAIYTGSVNSRSVRSARQTRVVQYPAVQPPVATPDSVRKDPDAVRTSNRALVKKLGVGAGVIVVLGAVMSLASGGGTSNADAAVSPTTTTEAPRATTTATTISAAGSRSAVPSPTTTIPASAGESRDILSGTTGILRNVLVDLMDSDTCEDLSFDLKFATDNFTFNSRQSEKIVQAVDYAQEYSIGGASCGGLSPYLNKLGA